jgi:hypothetical protein
MVLLACASLMVDGGWSRQITAMPEGAGVYRGGIVTNFWVWSSCCPVALSNEVGAYCHCLDAYVSDCFACFATKKWDNQHWSAVDKTVHTDGSVGTPSLHNHQRAAHTMSDKLTRIALVHDDKVSWCHRPAGPFHYGSLPVRHIQCKPKKWSVEICYPRLILLILNILQSLSSTGPSFLPSFLGLHLTTAARNARNHVL